MRAGNTKTEEGENKMYRNHWKRLLCLALALTLLMSIKACLPLPTGQTMRKTRMIRLQTHLPRPFTRTFLLGLPYAFFTGGFVTTIIIPMTVPSVEDIKSEDFSQADI